MWPSAISSLEQRHHLRAALAVEGAGRLVGQDDLPAVHQRAGDRHALLLAARKLARPVLEAVAQAERAEQLGRARAALGARQAGIDRRISTFSAAVAVAIRL